MLEIPVENIRYRQGDTNALHNGKGNGGSAALTIGGSVMTLCVKQLIERGSQLTADHFDVPVEDIEFSAGVFKRLRTNQSLSLAETAQLAAEKDREERTLFGQSAFTPPNPTYPNGCHVCEVEIDPETGLVDVLNYVSVEDVGRVLNPLLVEGQIHGGVAQGIGQAIKEHIVHDASAQLVTGSFMDYGMPLSTDIPQIVCASVEVPTAMNPLGVKGVGEAGAVGGLAATMNAVCNALAPLGIRHLDMPASPGRVWEAIQNAKG